MSDIEVDGKTLGQLAFEAYSRSVGGLTFDGKPIPGWNDLHGDRAKVQAGWEAAADEVGRWVRAGQIIDKAAEGPFVRAGYRPQKSRWEKLEASAEATADDSVMFEPLPPIGDERAAQARTSVPVEADDDTRDNAG